MKKNKNKFVFKMFQNPEVILRVVFKINLDKNVSEKNILIKSKLNDLYFQR